MLRRCLLLACVLAAVAVVHADDWAVLVAGSNGWYNYRHQADVCHAYQILRKNGFPEDHIVTMMYDDIADNEQNPRPGKIFNHPDGPDVYDGVVIDYKGADVTPANFLNVLLGAAGNTTGGTGKVLRSTAKDRVFVNFVDHGATGLVAFPSEYLYAKDLAAALTEMHKRGMFAELVFYLEACESGSMFAGGVLPADLPVYATTAANPFESSYACYRDDTIGTYLGDCYSVHWMENADASNLHKETLMAQYLADKNATTESHVCLYGEEAMGKQPVGRFLTYSGSSGVHHRRRAEAQAARRADAMDAREVKLALLQREHEMAAAKGDDVATAQAQHALSKELAERARMDAVWKTLVHDTLRDEDSMFLRGDDCSASSAVVEDHDCLATFVGMFEGVCGSLGEYGLRYVSTAASMCNAGVGVEEYGAALVRACPQKKGKW